MPLEAAGRLERRQRRGRRFRATIARRSVRHEEAAPRKKNQRHGDLVVGLHLCPRRSFHPGSKRARGATTTPGRRRESSRARREFPCCGLGCTSTRRQLQTKEGKTARAPREVRCAAAPGASCPLPLPPRARTPLPSSSPERRRAFSRSRPAPPRRPSCRPDGGGSATSSKREPWTCSGGHETPKPGARRRRSSSLLLRRFASTLRRAFFIRACLMRSRSQAYIYLYYHTLPLKKKSSHNTSTMHRESTWLSVSSSSQRMRAEAPFLLHPRKVPARKTSEANTSTRLP